jgi:hypothetical protein
MKVCKKLKSFRSGLWTISQQFCSPAISSSVHIEEPLVNRRNQPNEKWLRVFGKVHLPGTFPYFSRPCGQLHMDLKFYEQGDFKSHGRKDSFELVFSLSY